MRNIQYHIRQLREEGLTIIPDVYAREQCDDFIGRARAIFNSLMENGSKLINSDNQFIANPFRYDLKFLDILYHDFLDEILKVLLDEDYVMLSSTVLNRKKISQVVSGYQALGADWHTDSRYLDGGKRLEQGFSYISLILLNDFKEENGATHFVPGSLKSRQRPQRDGNYEYIVAEAKAGSMVLFDTGMWHRAGPSSSEDRWSVTTHYAPWFIKPYYRFPEMLMQEYGEEFVRSLTSVQRRLLHFNSIPPINEDERFSTLIKQGQHPFDKPEEQ